jgi:hypothetical protein
MLRNVIIVVALLAPSCAVLASTDCKSIASSVTVETGAKNSGSSVELSSGISFALKPTSANYREILGMAELSMVTGSSLTARFAADGVRCDSKSTRTDLIAIVRGGEEPTPIAPTSTAPTRPVLQMPPGMSASAARP